MKGYLYVLSNENYKGWLKLGITKNMTKRLRTYQTGDPFRGYKVEFVLEHPAGSGSVLVSVTFKFTI